MRRGISSRSIRATAAFTAFVLSLSTTAQEQKPGEVKTTVEVEILTLDVLALDSKDRPVLGLTKEDFEVKVGGKLQVIEGFDAPPPSRAPAAGGGTAPPPEPEPERIAGTTIPLASDRTPTLHVLFYFDLEQLAPSAFMEAASSARAVLASLPPKARIGVASYFGRAGIRLWDDTAVDLAERELATLATAPASAVSEANVRSYQAGVGSYQSQGRGPSRGWEERRRLESLLVQNIIDAEDARDYNLTVTASREFAEYLREERRRVDESVKELREVCERLALLQDRRHLLLFSQGIERVPGTNAMEFLRVSRKDRGRGSIDQLAVRDPIASAGQIDPQVPFDSSALASLVQLEKFLEASGVTFHLLDPTRGGEFRTAEHTRLEANRNFAEDRRFLQTGAAPLADSTGGLMKIGGSFDAVVRNVVDAAGSSYRLAVRLEAPLRGRRSALKVSVKRKGVTAHARAAYEPPAPASAVAAGPPAAGSQAATSPDSPAALMARQAEEAARRSRQDERRRGAARTAGKAIPVTITWRGRGAADPERAGRFFFKVDVAMPQDALRFVPESDAMTASVKIGVQAIGADGKPADESTDDLFLALTGEEYSAGAGKDVKKTVTLSLAPGAYDLRVSVNDVLGEAFGTATSKTQAE